MPKTKNAVNRREFLTDAALKMRDKFLKLSRKRQKEFLDRSAPKFIEEAKRGGTDLFDYLEAVVGWLRELHEQSEVKR